MNDSVRYERVKLCPLLLCCSIWSGVNMSDLRGLEKLTPSSPSWLTEPRMSQNGYNHVNINKGSHLLSRVAAPLIMIYSPNMHILNIQKRTERPKKGTNREMRAARTVRNAWSESHFNAKFWLKTTLNVLWSHIYCTFKCETLLFRFH